MERIGASRAWDFATGRGVTVAVVDTGIACETYGPYTKGSDLADTECVTGWNFVTRNEHANDDQGHGTHVAGTIAQSTNNAIGGAGIAFHARLMPVKVLNESGWGTTADVADGIRWAAEHGAHVVNLSLGGPRNSRVLQKAIDYALSRGTVVVAAAGNTGGRVQYPGASDGVIGVSASDQDDKIARFSSRGDGVDIAAPGVSVTQQTICKKGREKCEIFPAYDGTSMASPHVAGAAALVMSLGVTEPAAVEEALRKGARVVDDSDAGKKLYGAGVLQAATAVERVTFQHALARLLALAGLTFLIAPQRQEEERGRGVAVAPRLLAAGARRGPGAPLLHAVDPAARAPRHRPRGEAARGHGPPGGRVGAPLPAAGQRAAAVRAHRPRLRREEAAPGHRGVLGGHRRVPRCRGGARGRGRPFGHVPHAPVVRRQRRALRLDRADEPRRDQLTATRLRPSRLDPRRGTKAPCDTRSCSLRPSLFLVAALASARRAAARRARRPGRSSPTACRPLPRARALTPSGITEERADAGKPKRP